MPRNGSGTYTLPAGNPVADGTLITSSWGNTTLNDVAAAMTASYSADGQTPLTGPVKLTNGTVLAPSITFNAESSTGFYRPVINTVALSIAGADKLKCDSSTLTLYTTAIPTTTNVYNLGSTTNKFSTVYATTFSGTATTAQYADLAEKYVADAEYEAGTVVSFGGAYEITKATVDSKRIAGVISTHPAFLMNCDLSVDEGYVVAVALIGRVPCKVVGKVLKGDLLVSAGNGCARAEVNPAIGSVIGKALADFDGLRGTIEVVVGKV